MPKLIIEEEVPEKFRNFLLGEKLRGGLQRQVHTQEVHGRARAQSGRLVTAPYKPGLQDTVRNPQRVLGAVSGHRGRFGPVRKDGRCLTSPRNPAPVTAGVPGLEPRTNEPESSVLPITPYPNGRKCYPQPRVNCSLTTTHSQIESRTIAAETCAPAPAATMSCSGPGGVMSPAAYKPGTLVRPP